MSNYPNEGTGWGTILLCILFLLIAGFVALIYFDVLTTERIGSWFGFQKTPESLAKDQFKPQSISNTIETASCVRQSIPTSSSDNSPISIARLGWNVESGCCIDKYDGFSCSTSEISTYYKCSTSDVNGETKFILNNNHFLDLNLGITEIKNLHKSQWSC